MSRNDMPRGSITRIERGTQRFPWLVAYRVACHGGTAETKAPRLLPLITRPDRQVGRGSNFIAGAKTQGGGGRNGRKKPRLSRGDHACGFRNGRTHSVCTIAENPKLQAVNQDDIAENALNRASPISTRSLRIDRRVHACVNTPNRFHRIIVNTINRRSVCK